MKFGYRALAMSVLALLLFTAVASAASENKRLRQQCIDDCRVEATTCTTKCPTGDCLDSCTRPLDGCIKNCRKMHPRQAD